MTAPQILHVPTDRDDRVIHVVGQHQVLRLNVMDAQLAAVRLDKAIGDAAHAVDAPSRPMTEKQNRYLHALMGDQGITGDDRHRALSKILGREITSAKELDVDDASEAIDALQTSVTRRPTVPANREPF